MKWLVDILGMTLLSCPCFAADSYRVNAGQTIFVNEFATPKLVKNNGASAVFVPTRTSGEWSSFRTNKPAYIALSDCPANYVGIPPDTNTANAFCVMAYEAKDVGGVATSQAAVTPWTNLTGATARTRCQALGTGYDLLTVNEWQTVAQNVELVGANWSSGTVGSGCLKMGNSGANVTNCRYDGANPEFGTGRNALASMVLSTGQVIWDLGGNVSEHIVPSTDPTGSAGILVITVASATGTPKTLWGPVGNYSSGCGTDPTGYCGLGYLHYRSTPQNVSFRGGNYATEWGVFGMHSGYASTYNDATSGFRCRFVP